jgi:hypothetical protein
MFRAICLTAMNCLHILNTFYPPPPILTLKIEVASSPEAFETQPQLHGENIPKQDKKTKIR